MKKLICLFLMLWLPISAGSAWAMSTQMQVNAALDTATALATEMPCHDMADADNSLDQEAGIKHNCTSCGACFTILAAGTSSVAYSSPSVMTSRVALPADGQTISQTYPPALRPPIAS